MTSAELFRFLIWAALRAKLWEMAEAERIADMAEAG